MQITILHGKTAPKQRQQQHHEEQCNKTLRINEANKGGMAGGREHFVTTIRVRHQCERATLCAHCYATLSSGIGVPMCAGCIMRPRVAPSSQLGAINCEKRSSQADVTATWLDSQSSPRVTRLRRLTKRRERRRCVVNT